MSTNGDDVDIALPPDIAAQRNRSYVVAPHKLVGEYRTERGDNLDAELDNVAGKSHASILSDHEE